LGAGIGETREGTIEIALEIKGESGAGNNVENNNSGEIRNTGPRCRRGLSDHGIRKGKGGTDKQKEQKFALSRGGN